MLALYYSFFYMPILLTVYLYLVSLALRGCNIIVIAANKDLDIST